MINAIIGTLLLATSLSAQAPPFAESAQTSHRALYAHPQRRDAAM